MCPEVEELHHGIIFRRGSQEATVRRPSGSSQPIGARDPCAACLREIEEINTGFRRRGFAGVVRDGERNGVSVRRPSGPTPGDSGWKQLLGRAAFNRYEIDLG